MCAAVVGLGCPILDVKAAVGVDFLKVRDLALGKFYVAPGESLRSLYNDAVASGAEIQYSAGGSTQNVIRVAQWLLGGSGKCTFVGSVGDDEFARLLRTEVEKETSDADIIYVGIEGQTTGTCLALTLRGDKEDRRHQLFNAGASEMIASIELDDLILKTIVTAEYLYLECAYLSFAHDLLFKLAREQKSRSKGVVINLSNISVVNKHHESIRRLLPLADLIFAKEKEALALVPDAKTPEEAATHLSAQTTQSDSNDSRVVVVTRGTLPTIVAHNDQVESFPVPVIPKDKIVDFIGSGDAFVGGFLAEFVRPRQRINAPTTALLHRCVTSGHFASSEVIQHPGCTFSKDAAVNLHFE